MADGSVHSHPLRRCAPLGLLGLAGVLFIVLGGHRYLTFAALAEHRELLCTLAARGGALTALGFILVYAGLTALSVPGAVMMTLAGGFLFGPWLGTVYALIGATLGPTLVFLVARAGLAGFAARAGPLVRRLEAGFREDAFNYLLVLRLIPIFPFWLVNLVAGATGMPLLAYLTATFFGMIPGTFVYSGLGNGIGALIAAGQPPDLRILFHPSILLPIVGLAALALLPVFYKRWRGRGRRHHEPAR
ncbi:MAG TPA: TVP38/TMEM64 family protein [Stellaceae bacterium]|nr:TVP38/TMEM64 family protein [Stellaceae bacterium]